MSLFSRMFSRRLIASAIAVTIAPLMLLGACGEAPNLSKEPKSDQAAAPEKPSSPTVSSNDGEASAPAVEEAAREAEEASGATETESKDSAAADRTETKSRPPVKRQYYRRSAGEDARRKSASERTADKGILDTLGRDGAQPPPESAAPGSSATAPAAPESIPDVAGDGSSAYGTRGVGVGGGGTSSGGGFGGLGTVGKGSGSSASGRSTTPAEPVAEEEKKEPFEVVPVFYGTDRAVQPSAKRLEFGSDRAHQLQLGRAMVTVPTAHKVPNIERPWVIEVPYFKYKIYEQKEDPAKHFTMQEIKALSKEQLLAYVKERLANSETFKDSAFVFVHGYNTSFDAAVYRTAQIAYDLDFDGAPFVYSWPSGGGIASYTYDRASAEQAEPHLAEFLDMVIKESGAKSISLIAHSMGNEVLLRVLDRLRLEAPEGVKISQVILAAPDVDRDKFSNIAKEISTFAKGVTLYAASNDRALETSARFWGGVPRAGDVPSTGPLIVSGVDTIDVTAVSTETLSLNHSSYAENTKLLNDIKLLLKTGQRPPDRREPLLEKITTATGTFWRYPKAGASEAAPAEAPATGSVP